MKFKPTNWIEVKTAYQKREGSCRELAERFGVNPMSVENKCKRDGWRKQMTEINQKVTEKVTRELISYEMEWREQAFEDSQNMAEKLKIALRKTKVSEVDKLLKLSQARLKVHELAKSALGVTEKVDATSGEQSLQETILKSINTIHDLYDAGKLTIDDAKRVDVEAIANSEVDPETLPKRS